MEMLRGERVRFTLTVEETKEIARIRERELNLEHCAFISRIEYDVV